MALTWARLSGHVLWQWRHSSLGVTLRFDDPLWLASRERVAEPMVRCCGIKSCMFVAWFMQQLPPVGNSLLQLFLRQLVSL